MRKTVVVVVCVATVLFGCAAAPPRDDGKSLLHPPGLSVEQRKCILGECYRWAISDTRAKAALAVLGEQGNNEVTDRYVLCFLSRGYTWPNPKAGN